MESIINANISISGITEKNELMDFSMDVVPNKHGRAELKLRILDGGNSANILKMPPEKIITITSEQAGNSGVLFKGYISDCFVNKVKGDEIVNISLISTTIDMDKEKKSQSYQKQSEQYSNIIKDVLSSVSGVCEIGDNEIKSGVVEKPLIRYRETEWEFIKRIASRHRVSISPDVTADKPTVIIGAVKKNTIPEESFRSKQYIKRIKMGVFLSRKHNEENSRVSVKDFSEYELRSFGNFYIGDSVTYKGENMIIYGKHTNMEEGELVFTYDVRNDKVSDVQPMYNRLLEGRSLEGKVVKAENETLKIQLDVDEEERKESELYPFPWKPDTGNIMYAMPEKGSIVTLYISGHEEGEAIVINTLYRENKKDRDNPSNRYFTTKENKRLFLKEKEVGFSLEANDDGKNRLAIKDDVIEIKTEKNIVLQAGGNVIINGKKVTLDGKKELQLTQEKNGIDIKKRIDIISKKVKLGIGAGVPDAPKQARKLQLERLSDAQTKIKNTGLASDKVTSLTGAYAKANEKFRGDQFKRSGSFNGSMSAVERSEIICSNVNMTCPLGENLDGHIKSNDRYQKNVSDDEKRRLSELREKSAPITKYTIMQKVVPKATMESYIEKKWKTVRNCASKASDAAPYTTSSKEVYENLRLDYKGEKIVESDGSIKYTGGMEYKNLAETGGEVYILRFTSKTCPDNKSLPNATNGNGAPCTESGFTGSDNCLIPETMYDESTITDGAFFMVDKDGNEYLAAAWDIDEEKFVEVE